MRESSYVRFFVLFPAKRNRHFIDVETGKDVFVTNKDSMYYIDVKYWAYGFLIIGLIVFAVAMVTAFI